MSMGSSKFGYGQNIDGCCRRNPMDILTLRRAFHKSQPGFYPSNYYEISMLMLLFAIKTACLPTLAEAVRYRFAADLIVIYRAVI